MHSGQCVDTAEWFSARRGASTRASGRVDNDNELKRSKIGRHIPQVINIQFAGNCEMMLGYYGSRWQNYYYWLCHPEFIGCRFFFLVFNFSIIYLLIVWLLLRLHYILHNQNNQTIKITCSIWLETMQTNMAMKEAYGRRESNNIAIFDLRRSCKWLSMIRFFVSCFLFLLFFSVSRNAGAILNIIKYSMHRTAETPLGGHKMKNQTKRGRDREKKPVIACYTGIFIHKKLQQATLYWVCSMFGCVSVLRSIVSVGWFNDRLKSYSYLCS